MGGEALGSKTSDFNSDQQLCNKPCFLRVLLYQEQMHSHFELGSKGCSLFKVSCNVETSRLLKLITGKFGLFGSCMNIMCHVRYSLQLLQTIAKNNNGTAGVELRALESGVIYSGDEIIVGS